MPTDPHRELIQKRELAIAIEALMREEMVVNYYAARGKKVISVDDNQTRQVLNMERSAPSADVLVELGPRSLLIAEVKGSNIDRALDQLRSTASKATRLYTHIACKIYVRTPTPEGDAVDLRGGRNGFRAVRILYRSFPGEWILYEYDTEHLPLPLQIGSEPVCVVFGPHV